MSARRQIVAALSEDSLGGIATLQDVDRATALVDAYRTEVIAKAIGRLRAVPVTCVALTGPAWYGTGWNDAITTLEEIADYQTPDDEAYPGELQRLRALTLGLRVAALRKEDLAETQRLLSLHAEHESQERDRVKTGTAPDFYQPRYVYSYPRYADGHNWKFRCDAITTHPDDGARVALGWRHWQGEWTECAYDEGDWDVHNCDPAGNLIATSDEEVAS